MNRMLLMSLLKKSCMQNFPFIKYTFLIKHKMLMSLLQKNPHKYMSLLLEIMFLKKQKMLISMFQKMFSLKKKQMLMSRRLQIHLMRKKYQFSFQIQTQQLMLNHIHLYICWIQLETMLLLTQILMQSQMWYQIASISSAMKLIGILNEAYNSMH